MSKLTSLYEKLGYGFKDPSLLQQALTHSSKSATQNFERLEFLGDRILGFCVAAKLYELYPEEAEGPLARRFTNLVRRETLAEIAQKLGLQDHIILSENEKRSGGHLKESVLADVCESLIAAIFLDGGIDSAQHFIHKHWQGYFKNSAMKKKDSKSALQEYAQSLGKDVPTYQVLSKTGSSHKPEYEIEVSVGGLPSASAKGASKREAEQRAAKKLLDIIHE